jgi:hypothetical protein
LSVQVSAAKDNFMSVSAISSETFVANTLPELQNLSVQGSAVKDGQLSINLAGNVSFSTLSYQLSRDGGRNWVSLGSPNYSIRFNDLGGNLNFRIIQSAAGYLTQVTELDPIAVDGSYSLPGFLQGSIDGANSGNEVEGGAKVGSVLRASKSVWPANTRVTGFWWSSNGSSVSNKLIYKSQAKDIDSQLVYVEVGVSETGVTKYRLSAPVHVLPLEFENSSKPVLVGSSSIGSRLKATITTGWSSGAKYFYQWLSNGEVIPSAVGPTYTITSEDVGSVVSVRACASKLAFLTKCEESSATGVIQKSQIFLSTKPSVKLSSTKLGRQLVGTLGKWQTGLTFTYEWLRDGVVVPDETKTTYLLRAADDGHEMSFRVTASKPGYFDLTKASSPKVFK